MWYPCPTHPLSLPFAWANKVHSASCTYHRPVHLPLSPCCCLLAHLTVGFLQSRPWGKNLGTNNLGVALFCLVLEVEIWDREERKCNKGHIKEQVATGGNWSWISLGTIWKTIWNTPQNGPLERGGNWVVIPHCRRLLLGFSTPALPSCPVSCPQAPEARGCPLVQVPELSASVEMVRRIQQGPGSIGHTCPSKSPPTMLPPLTLPFIYPPHSNTSTYIHAGKRKRSRMPPNC